MQEQEGIHHTPEYAPPNEWVGNMDAREQRQWQAPPQQEYAERPYEEGYSGQDSMDAWFREDEKIRPGNLEKADSRDCWYSSFYCARCSSSATSSVSLLVISAGRS